MAFPSQQSRPASPSPSPPISFLPLARPVSPFGTLRGNALAEARLAAAEPPDRKASPPSDRELDHQITMVDEYRTWDARLLRSVIQLGNDLEIDEWLTLGDEDEKSSIPDIPLPPLPVTPTISPRPPLKPALVRPLPQRSSTSTRSSASTSLSPSSASARSRIHPKYPPQSVTDESVSSEPDFEHLFQVLSIAAQYTSTNKADRARPHRNSSSHSQIRDSAEAGPSYERADRRPRALSSSAGLSRQYHFDSTSDAPLPFPGPTSTANASVPSNPQQSNIALDSGLPRVRKKRAYTTVSSTPTSPISSHFSKSARQLGQSRSAVVSTSCQHGSHSEDPIHPSRANANASQSTYQYDHTKSRHQYQSTLHV